MKVVVDLPDKLYKVLAAEAILLDKTIERNLVKTPEEIVESWLDSDWPQATFEEGYGKTPKALEKT